MQTKCCQSGSVYLFSTKTNDKDYFKGLQDNFVVRQMFSDL